VTFSVRDDVWHRFPGLLLVVAVARDLDNSDPNPAVLQELRDAEHHLKGSWEFPNAQSHPRIKAWRDAFRQLGLSGKEYPSSIEALARRVLSGGNVPDINPVVNCYNARSLRYLVPAGGWDVAGLPGGTIVLGLTTGTEQFRELGSAAATPVGRGEVSYLAADTVITRHFVWRQSETAKVTPATRVISPESSEAITRRRPSVGQDRSI